MANLKGRLSKLLANSMDVSRLGPLDRALARYAVKDCRHTPSFDKVMLADTLIALYLKDVKAHPKCGFAQDFLAWASTTDFLLIERAERIIGDLVAAKYLPKAPTQWKAVGVALDKVQPPYSCYCNAEQLKNCPKFPFWSWGSCVQPGN